jgi:NAD(P)-dependent dehydrogenase (short-subunit alcohol dehydrogenase family)
MKENIEKEFGRLDGLLHNAGTLGTLSPVEHYPIEQWYQVLQVNLNSVFHLSQSLLPLLKKSSAASLIFSATPASQLKNAYWGAYGVSKAALESFMQILAEELEHTAIRVNSINPGAVNTTLRSRAYPAETAEALAKPEEIVNAYLYLMSSDSHLVNGQCIKAADFMNQELVSTCIET